MRRILTVLALCAIATPVWPDEVCPAPINSGTWDAWVNGTGTGSVSTLNWVQSQPASARGQAQIDASACDGTFILQMPRLTFPMTSTGNAAPGDPQTYTGSTVVQGMNWEMELTLLNDSELAGGFGASMTTSGITVGATVNGMGLRYPANNAAQPAACYCRTHLEVFIDKELDSARRYHDLYENAAYYGRPANWPPDADAFFRLWKTSTYKRVIELMARGYSHIEATDRVLANSNELGSQISGSEDYIPPQAQSGSESTGGGDDGAVEYYSVQLATVDDQCNLQVGNAHQDSCYPDIALQSTMIHENVHVAECNGNVSISGIQAYAESEVRGYAAEIEWLESWIDDNCG